MIRQIILCLKKNRNPAHWSAAWKTISSYLLPQFYCMRIFSRNVKHPTRGLQHPPMIPIIMWIAVAAAEQSSPVGIGTTHTLLSVRQGHLHITPRLVTCVEIVSEGCMTRVLKVARKWHE